MEKENVGLTTREVESPATAINQGSVNTAILIFMTKVQGCNCNAIESNNGVSE